MQGPDSLDLPSYGEGPVDALIDHYGADRLAETVQREEYVKQALTFSELRTEWKAFRNYLSKQPRGTLQSQLKELDTNEMHQTMFPISALSQTSVLLFPLAPLPLKELLTDEANKNMVEKPYWKK